MDLPRPLRLIPRSPWNFYQFLSSDVPRSSFLKFPGGSRRFLFLTSPPYLYCVFTRLSTVFFFFLSPVLFTVLIFTVRDRPPTTRPTFIAASSMPGFSADLFVSHDLSILSLFSRIFFLPSPTRWSPAISPERPPPSPPPSRIPTRDNPYKLEH